MYDVLLSVPWFSSLSSVESGLLFILQVVLTFWMPLFSEIECKYATSCYRSVTLRRHASRRISPCRFHAGEDLENRLVQVFSFTYCICNWRGRGLVVEGCSNVTKLPAYFVSVKANRVQVVVDVPAGWKMRLMLVYLVGSLLEILHRNSQNLKKKKQDWQN